MQKLTLMLWFNQSSKIDFIRNGFQMFQAKVKITCHRLVDVKVPVAAQWHLYPQIYVSKKHVMVMFFSSLRVHYLYSLFKQKGEQNQFYALTFLFIVYEDDYLATKKQSMLSSMNKYEIPQKIQIKGSRWFNFSSCQ